MSVENLAQYSEKKVILVVNEGEDKDAVELEGVAVVATEDGILLREKGKTKTQLIEAPQIIEIRYAPETRKSLTRKVLKPVEYGSARSHLLERHGLKLAEVNELTEGDALDFHEQLDHVELDLGHIHQSVTETPAVQAVSEAASQLSEG